MTGFDVLEYQHEMFGWFLGLSCGVGALFLIIISRSLIQMFAMTYLLSGVLFVTNEYRKAMEKYL